MKKSSLKSEQVFVKVIEKNRKKFLRKLAAHKGMTLHTIFLKGEHYTWNADFTGMIPSTKYAALLSYTTT